MSQELSDAKLYEQWCAHIRATDEISFKLIGIVPLVSGTRLAYFFVRGPTCEGSHRAVTVCCGDYLGVIPVGTAESSEL